MDKNLRAGIDQKIIKGFKTFVDAVAAQIMPGALRPVTVTAIIKNLLGLMEKIN